MTTSTTPIRRAAVPAVLADGPRTTATQVWVLLGQATVCVALFLGFGVLPLPAPMAVVALTVSLTASTVLLAPHGRVGQVRLYPATVGLMWWWALSLLWTLDPAQWWVETLGNLPIVVAVVVAVAVASAANAATTRVPTASRAAARSDRTRSLNHSRRPHPRTPFLLAQFTKTADA